MIWFTSDTHFGHSNIIKLAERPFADVDEMEDSLVANINSLVAPSDELYHLGDFSMKLGLEEQARILRRIRCRNIHLIPGNHDKRLDELAQEGLFALENPSSNSGATSADTRCATSLSRTGMEKEEAPSICMAIFAAKALPTTKLAAQEGYFATMWAWTQTDMRPYRSNASWNFLTAFNPRAA